MSMSTAEFNSLLLDPQYDAIGVPARIIPVSGKAIEVTVIDHTAGLTVSEGGQFQLETIRPVVCVRLSELAENKVTISDVADGQVVMDPGEAAEKTWRIKVPREDKGELQLVLLDETPQ
jgi:hypothetical protein